MSCEKTVFQGRSKQILIRIADNGELRTGELMKMLELKRSNISNCLMPLKRYGFIESRQSKSDKRVYYHSLTAEGRRYMDSWDNVKYWQSRLDYIDSHIEVEDESGHDEPVVKTKLRKYAEQILINLSKNSSLTTTVLVGILGITRPNTCTHLSNLKKRGLVKSEQAEHDKRFYYHSLTDSGRQYAGGLEREPTCKLKKKSRVFKKKAGDESIDDVLDEADKIVYNDEFTIETEEGDILSF